MPPKTSPLSPHCRWHDKAGALVHKISPPLQSSQVARECRVQWGKCCKNLWNLWTLESFRNIIMHIIYCILKYGSTTKQNRRHPFHTHWNQTILFPWILFLSSTMSQCHNLAWPLIRPASKIHHDPPISPFRFRRPEGWNNRWPDSNMDAYGCKSLFEAPPHQIVPQSPAERLSVIISEYSNFGSWSSLQLFHLMFQVTQLQN